MKLNVYFHGEATINVNYKAGDGGAAELRIFEKMLEELTELLEELPDGEPGEPAALTLEDDLEDFLFLNGTTFTPYDLMLACKPDAIHTAAGRQYLTGTAVVFDALGSATVSLDQKELRQIRHILETQCKTVFCGGQPVRALPL